MPLWQHGADPIEVMQIEKMVGKFREEMEKDDGFLQKKCQQYFTVCVEST